MTVGGLLALGLEAQVMGNNQGVFSGIKKEQFGAPSDMRERQQGTMPNIEATRRISISHRVLVVWAI